MGFVKSLVGLALLCGLLLGPPAAEAQTTDGSSRPTAEADALAPLLDALEDPEARARLIAALRETTALPAPVADTGEEPANLTFAARLADATLLTANTFVERVQTIAADISALRVLPSVLTPEREAQLRAEGLALVLTIFVTVAIHRALRILSRRLFSRPAAENAPVLTLAGQFAGQFLLRLFAVLVAWVAGYGLAFFVFGTDGVALPQALYLNAFLIFGLFSMALSMLVTHHPADLTFANLPLQTQAIIYRSVRRVAGVAFYGLIAAVPIAQSWTNFVVARSLRTVILTLFALLAIAAIHRIARALKEDDAAHVTSAGAHKGARDDMPEELGPEALGTNSTRVWNTLWPWLGYLYVLVAYSVSIANPNMIVDLVGRATIFSALALVVALIGLRLLRLAPKGMGAPIPRVFVSLLPTLPDRLSTFVRPAVVVLGLGALAVAGLLLLEGWRILDLQNWLATTAKDFAWRTIGLVLLFIGLILFWAVLSSYVDKKLSADVPESQQVSARSRTLLALFRNTVSIALVIFGGMTLLSELGVDIAPLLAGAGVIGLAIGFGAQKLVQDIITGVFIQLENAINEGDVVTVAGITGGVENLTIRSVGIRDLTGTYHIIPFSAVDTVGNYMRRFAYHVEVVGVAYESDLDATRAALEAAFDAVKAGPLGDDITEPLEYHGVVGLGESSVNIRVRIKTKPGMQWGVGRAYTQEVKRALDAAGIEIPFPHRELKLPPEMLQRLAQPGAETASA